MNDCWEVLELPPGSPLKDIRRAYARILKETRADDSPLEFQKLRRAYELACFLAKGSGSAGILRQDLGYNLERPVDIPGPQTAPPEARAGGTISGFFDELERLSLIRDGRDLAEQCDALQSHPAAQSLIHRAYLSERVFAWAVSKHQRGELVPLTLLRACSALLDWEHAVLDFARQYSYTDVAYIFFRLELRDRLLFINRANKMEVRLNAKRAAITVAALAALVGGFISIG